MEGGRGRKGNGDAGRLGLDAEAAGIHLKEKKECQGKGLPKKDDQDHKT